MQKPKIILKGDNGEHVYELAEGQILFAGRTAECDICLPSPSVSRRHAILVMRGGKCGLKDMGSGNGTYLNGKRLEGPAKLRHGDVIHIASHRLEFIAPPAPSAPAVPAAPARFRQAQETMLLSSEQILERLRSEIGDIGAPPAASPPAARTPEPAPAHSREEPQWPAPSAARSAAGSRLLARDDPDGRNAPREALRDKQPERPARPKIDADTVHRVRESIRRLPKAPPVPKLAQAPLEEELGDGSGDTGLFTVIPEHELDSGEAAGDAALNGELPEEFTAEEREAADLVDVKETLEADDEDEPDAASAGPDAQPAGTAASARTGADRESAPPPTSSSIPTPGAGLLPLPPEEANPNAIPIGPAFREAIELRMFYYSYMEDLRQEREDLLAANPDAADAVKSEVDRQNREMAKPPNADQATDRIAKVNARRDALREKIREAKTSGGAMPPRPSKPMRAAEDIGITQWTIIAESLRSALPAAFAAGYEGVKDEPFAAAAEKAGIDAKTLMGGSAYCLALEELLNEAKFNRAVVREKMAELPPPDEKKASGGGKLLGRFGRRRDEGDEDGPDGPDDAGADGDSYESLKEDDRQLGLRSAWITQELAFAEEMLIKEFWSVYLQTALRFIPKHREMERSVRAFLRYGVVGFGRWWLDREVAEFVLDDCANDVRHDFEVSASVTNIVYADEYLAAVMEERCTPAMDENLEINEKNSPNWKADKALRRLINTRATIARTTELVDSLQTRLDDLGQKGAALDDRIANLLQGSKNYKQIKQELSQDRQAIRIEVGKLNKLAEKLRDSIKGELGETVGDVEERFRSGELPRPTPEFMIEREVGQVRRIGRLTANLKERLLPLAMREYQLNTDAANDRLSVNGELADIERRDPRLFMETLVDSKKKANRVDMRISPVVVLLPSAGVLAFSWNPRQKPEDGRLALPTFFTRQRIRERQMIYLMSDFRWDTAKANAGMDLMNSETIVAEFMRVRWDWRKRSREMREKGLIYTEQNDRTNWRRVYEAYLTTAYDGGKKLYNRNYDFYERVIGKYFDLPEGVELLRK